MRLGLVVTVLCVSGTRVAHAAPEDPFRQSVRLTDAKSPEEERAAFHLPPGFEMQLFAAEPQIAKPINMAFDARGRLWLTESREYPFPAKPGAIGRDAIKVLEDTDGDGRADKVTTFADGLNIPIGLLPYKNGVIAWSIPNIWFFEDTDGDGKADRREILFGPLGWEKDQHGMSASFRRGYDGWMYLTHGFSNASTIKAKDGSELRLVSGNTYRVRVDGSRVEGFAFGQVNPFGLTFDGGGNLFSADCHSAAIYQLLRGGFYPSFGKPHDGLGFAPPMIDHGHGSSALSGIVHYTDDRWPAEFKDNVFTGNVMTSRINRDRLETTGSTPRAIESPDLVTTDDPWFRPVDLQLGPDGALYIADFYNRIIGHYEVPLDHPGRDRERGRIWRMVYRGTQARPMPRETAALTRELASANPTRRMLAMNELADRGGHEVVASVRQAMSRRAEPRLVANGLWILHRLGALPASTLRGLARHPDPLVRVHVQRVLAETADWTVQQRQAVVAALVDRAPIVQRAAADALGRHPAFEQVSILLTMLARVPAEDTHLKHVVRMALRDHLSLPGSLDRLAGVTLEARQARQVADVSLGVPNAEASRFLLHHIQHVTEPLATIEKQVRHVARYADGSSTDVLASFLERHFVDDPDRQLSLFVALDDGATARGEPLGPAIRSWGTALAMRALTSVDDDSSAWHALSLAGKDVATNPWSLERVKSQDGKDHGLFVVSAEAKATGILRSPPFLIPPTLSFHLAGNRSLVRLRAATTNAVLAEAAPEDREVAALVVWNPKVPAGSRGMLEVVDQEKGADDWIAVGGFEPALPSWPRLAPRLVAERLVAAAHVAERLGARELAVPLRSRLAAAGPDPDRAGVLARALAATAPDETANLLAPLVADPLVPGPTRLALAASLAAGTPWRRVWQTSLRTTPLRIQAKFAQRLAATPVGAEELLAMIEKGEAPTRLLLDRGVTDRLAATHPQRLAERSKRLLTGVVPGNDDIQKLIEMRRTKYDASRARAANGEQLFVRICSACHRVGSEGRLIGPQLDGIGSRGLERLLEDVLDPNRNVDNAFRAQYITLASGEVITALPRQEEGQILVVTELTGTERRIAKKDIRERHESDTSLMPENFGEILTPEELNDLMAFLLTPR